MAVHTKSPRISRILFGNFAMDNWRFPFTPRVTNKRDIEILNKEEDTAMDLVPIVVTLVTVIW